jgi:hypothetical protein
VASVAIIVEGDRCTQLRGNRIPVIARREGDNTILDMRSVASADDRVIVDSLVSLAES